MNRDTVIQTILAAMLATLYLGVVAALYLIRP